MIEEEDIEQLHDERLVAAATAGSPGDLLQWIDDEDHGGQRGILNGRPETTLFLLSDYGCCLTGAFIPDEQDGNSYEFAEDAKRAAEAFMRNWVRDCAPLVNV